MPLNFQKSRLAIFPIVLVLSLTSMSTSALEIGFQARCLGAALRSLMRLDKTPKTPLVFGEWENLPSPYSRGLPELFDKTLNESPAVETLRKQYGNGRGLIFKIPQYDANVVAGKASSSSGEMVQAIFFRETIKRIFPEAKVLGSRDIYTRTDIPELWLKFQTQVLKRKVTDLFVEDSAEQGHRIIEQNVGLLGRHGDRFMEMSLLKSANPGPKLPAKSVLREWLGLKPTDRIISVYSSILTSKEDTLSMVDALTAKKSVDTIILSIGRSSLRQDVRKTLAKRSNVNFLSSTDELKNHKFMTGKTIILNETRDRLPYIHGAADATVVVGAPNIFESLNAGTPTIVQRKAEANFNQEAWDKLTNTALRTGGAYRASSLAEAASIADRLELQPPARPAFNITGPDNKTPVDRLIQAIANTLIDEKSSETN